MLDSTLKASVALGTLTPVDLVHLLVLPQQHRPYPRRVADRGENRRSPESTECLARVRSEETVFGVRNALRGIIGHTRKRSV